MVGSISLEVSLSPCAAIAQLTFGQSNAQTHHYPGLPFFIIIIIPTSTHDIRSLATPTRIHTMYGTHLLVPTLYGLDLLASFGLWLQIRTIPSLWTDFLRIVLHFRHALPRSRVCVITMGRHSLL